MVNDRFFSSRLEHWLNNGETKTVADLVEVFHEKSFAVSLVVLMFIPALPLPTGGISHVLELIAVLISSEIVIGRKTIWLPKRLYKKDISKIGERKSVKNLIAKLKWVENHSKPRLKNIVKNEIFFRTTGIILIIFSITAFSALPFSGLDTLPAMGVVVIALSLIFEDMLLYIAGFIIGSLGIATVIGLGALLSKSLKLWF